MRIRFRASDQMKRRFVCGDGPAWVIFFVFSRTIQQLGLLLWNVFENRKRTFSVFKTDRQPYGLENGPFSGEIFRFSFSGRPPLGNGAPFSINIVIETGAWIWSRHGFPHIVRGNKRSNVPKTAGQAAPAWQLLSPNTHPHTPQAPRRADGIGQ